MIVIGKDVDPIEELSNENLMNETLSMSTMNARRKLMARASGMR